MPRSTAGEGGTDKGFHCILIAPYPEMGAVFTPIARRMGCRLRVVVGQEDAAVAVARATPPDDCDVFLSRSINVAFLKRHTAVPVVAIEMTAMDLLRLLLPDVGKVRRVAWFRYAGPLRDVDCVAGVLGMEIRECLFRSRAEARDMAAELEPGSVDLVVGGTYVRDFVAPLGFSTRQFRVDEETAARCLREAAAIAEARRLERRRAARIHAVFNAVSEGLLVLDEKGAVSHVNTSAARLLKRTPEDLLDKDIRAAVPGGFLSGEGLPDRAERGRVRDIGGVTLVVNRVPVTVQGKSAGLVFSFSDAGSIRRAEGRLRSSLKACGFTARYTFDNIEARSPVMRQVKELAALYASTDANLLICGESGTGKEIFAQSIHAGSRRADSPFVAVNCAAIPEGLLESELFGYEEGAFTGARRQGKAGMFELAHTGTLFLDEVGDLPLLLQGRLLRVLQEREIVRVGGTQVIPLDVRVICATNRDLEDLVRRRLFRADLYYRLNVLNLTLPPLRERPEDIVPMAVSRLRKHLRPTPPAEVMERALGPLLTRRAWPGNVRELFSVLERLALIANHTGAGTAGGRDWARLLARVWQGADPALESPPGEACAADLRTQVRALERKIIETALAATGQDLGAAARRLGISRMTLWRKLQP